MNKFEALEFIQDSFITDEQHQAFEYLLQVWNTNDERTKEEIEAVIPPPDYDVEADNWNGWYV